MPNKKTTGVISAAVFCAAMTIFVPWKNASEGFTLRSFQDVAGVWTNCHGVAYVKPHSVSTSEECKVIDNQAEAKYMNEVVRHLEFPISPLTLAAHAHFEFNIGEGNYARSRTLKYTNAGRVAEGCRAMTGFETLTVGGVKYDCGKPEFINSVKDCRGIVNRRNDEVQKCLQGVSP